MNPQCASCKKTVYPVEKLNCLDKYWHKGCFKCQTCNMGLTMKNYKGYNKMPYCSAHYPTTKFTAVADTPENLRLKKQTKQQSNIEYHKEFETSKGAYTAVADDPESLRVRRTQEAASNIAYKSGSEKRSSAGSRPYGVGPAEPSVPTYPPPPAASAMPPPPQPQVTRSIPPTVGVRYAAVYDYVAADEDEVSFNEGDIVTEVTVIDEGWVEGRVERTGKYGMIPSNYIERV